MKRFITAIIMVLFLIFAVGANLVLEALLVSDTVASADDDDDDVFNDSIKTFTWTTAHEDDDVLALLVTRYPPADNEGENHGYLFSETQNPNAVPVPGTFCLMMAGLCGLARIRCRVL